MKSPSIARPLIGCDVKYEYNTPAISCCSSFRAKKEGRVTSIRHNPTAFFGRDTLVVLIDGQRFFASLKSVTFVRKPGGKWRKFKCPKDP